MKNQKLDYLLCNYIFIRNVYLTFFLILLFSITSILSAKSNNHNCQGTTDDDIIESFVSCTNLNNPIQGDVNISPNVILQWDTAYSIVDPAGYRLTIGTSPGGNDILDNFDVGVVYTYVASTNYNYGDTIYVVITPYNYLTDAYDCTEEWFVIEDAPILRDLALTLEVATPEPYNTGDTIEYLITLYNQGTEDEVQVKIKDYIPEGLLFDNGINPGWNNGEKLLYTVNGGDTVVSTIKLIMLEDYSPIDYINRAEIIWVMEPSMESIVYSDIDSNFDTDPDNDAGGAPDSPSDNSVDGDGSGAPGDMDATTDEDDADPAMLIPFEDCTAEIYFTLTDCDLVTDKVYVNSNVSAYMGKPTTLPMDIVVNGQHFMNVNTLAPFIQSSNNGLMDFDLSLITTYPYQATLDSAAASYGGCNANGNFPLYITYLEVLEYPTFNVTATCGGEESLTVYITLASGELIQDYDYTGSSPSGSLNFFGDSTSVVGDTVFTKLYEGSADQTYFIEILDCSNNQILGSFTNPNPCYIAGPNCTNLSVPMNEEHDVAIDATISWDVVTGATGYLLTLGTTPGGTDILEDWDNNTTTYNHPTDFNYGDTIYVNITPHNDNNDAVDCQEEWFVVEELIEPGYCPGPFNQNSIDSGLSGAKDIETGDLDNDGDMDFVVLTRYDNELLWYENNGGEVFTKHVLDGDFQGNTYMKSSLADLDGDGDLDIIAVADYDGSVWWENTGNGNFVSHTLNGLNQPSWVEVGDIDGDGDLDILEASSTYNDIAWLKNNGNQVFTKINIDLNFSGVSSVKLNDLDDDGDIDIIGSSRNQGVISWWKNNGYETFSKITLSDVFYNVSNVVISDMDGDGDKDLVVTKDYGTDNMAIYHNDGNEIFVKTILSSTYGGSKTIVLTDLDNDGDEDIVTTGSGLLWWEQTSTDVYLKREISNFNGEDVCIDDINSDGSLDIIAMTTSAIYYWANNCSSIIPSCTMLNSPVNGSEFNSINSDISWNIEENAFGYIINAGYNSGGVDIIDSIDVGNVLTYDLGTMEYGSEVFVTINPYNLLGVAIDCNEESFFTSSARVYVDHTATGENNGTSWINAFTFLHDAFISSEPGDTIMVAQGTYYPDEGNGVVDNDRDARYTMKSPLYVMGGFPQGGSSLNDRDWDIYSSILSGEIQQDGDSTNNSRTQVYTSYGTTTSTIDGFIFEDGYAENSTKNPEGAGSSIFLEKASLTIKNCRFRNNYAKYGGAIHTSRAYSPNKLIINNCHFDNNTAVQGGCFYTESTGSNNKSNSLFLTDCTFDNNSSIIFGNGNNNSKVYSKLVNCTIINSGSIYNYTHHNGKASADLYNCLIINSSGVSPGIGFPNNIVNCTFFNNDNTNYEGASLSGNSNIYNSIFWAENDTIIVSNSNFQNSIYYDGNDDGILMLPSTNTDLGGNYDSNPNFMNTSGGDFSFANCSPALDGGDNTINTLSTDLYGNPRIFNNIIDMGAYESQQVYCMTVCSELTVPIDGDVDVSVESNFDWDHTASATGYILYISTSSMGNDILDSLDVGYINSFNDIILPPNSTLFARVYPYNSLGILDDCQEISFTTGAMPPPVSCTYLSSPINTSTGINTTVNVQWQPDPNATSYNVSIGTNIAATNILNNVDIGNINSWSLTDLNFGDTIYVKIIPKNATGQAMNCMTEWFVVEEYCSILAYTSYSSGLITNVTFAEVSNPSGTPSPAYTNYSNIIFPVVKDSTYDFLIDISYTSNVKVWIDYDQSNSFDTDEIVFDGGGVDPSGPITIPLTALDGKTGMRVISNPYNIPSDPCQNFSQGEIEDYSVEIFNLPPVPGCTSPSAHNYNPNATQDDGSCETCFDAIQNGDETGIDCGGANCDPCPCTHPDFAALMALYNSTDGPNWTNNTGWIDGAAGTDCEPCNWYGVTCDGNDRVFKIILPNNGLNGHLPTEIGDLITIKYLFLNSNQLSGQIPSSIGNLQSLIKLFLYHNQLSGQIPIEIGNMSDLQDLALMGNSLIGSIPSEVGNLSELVNLGLSSNQLSGNIPVELGALSNLEQLVITFNQLSGSIPPELGDLNSLTRLLLHTNQLSGSIPPELGNLSNLTDLYLDHNQLNGLIPSELGNLSNLNYFILNSNNLKGCIPSELHNLCGNVSNGNISNNTNLATQSWSDFCSTGAGSCNPPCTSLSSPMAGDTVTSVDTDLVWNTALGSTGYKLILGSCSGCNDILDTTDVGNVLTYDPGVLPNYSSIFVSIMPYNDNGEAMSCGEEMFVVEDVCLLHPIITCPDDITITCEDDTNPTSTGIATATVSCGNVTISYTDNLNLTLGNTGNIIRNWKATSDYGIHAYCTQLITLEDNIYPSLTCPANIYTSSDPGSCGTAVTDFGTPVATDNCGVASITNNAGTYFGVGSTVVTWTVTDYAGNAVSCTQTINVADDTSPSIACPPDITVEANNAAGDEATGVNLGMATTSDNCTSVSTSNNATEPYVLGDNIVTWTATDGNNNTSTCDQTITVIPPNPNILDYTISLGNHVVDPLEGTPYTVFRFEVEYTNENGDMPTFGFPRCLLDYEGDGVYTGSNDHTLIMLPVDDNDTDVTDGKDYYVEVSGLLEGGNWQALFQNVSGLYTTSLGPIDEPTVFDPLDISIFAGDISFSENNPLPGASIDVTATIHNYSSFDANNFKARLYNEFDGTTYTDIDNISVAAGQSTQVTWTISVPNATAFVPMRVYIDVDDVLVENNELDNNAVRPFVTGSWTNNGGNGGGAIVVNNLDLEIESDSTTLTGIAYYTGDLFPPGTKVAGGEVSFIISTTGETYTTTTDANGGFSYKFASPGGSYVVDGEVTDFTLTGTFTIEPCYQDLTTRVKLTGGFKIDNNLYAVLGESLNVSFSTYNSGCLMMEDVSTSSYTSTGSIMPSNFPVVALDAGDSMVVLTAVSFTSLGSHSLSMMADVYNEAFEGSESNNASSVGITIIDSLADLHITQVLVEPGIERCGGYTQIKLENIGGVQTGSFVVRLIKSKGGVALDTVDHTLSSVGPLGNLTFSHYDVFDETGTHTYEIIIDPDNLIQEIDESNNIANTGFNVNPCPEDFTDISISGCSANTIAQHDPHNLSLMNLEATVRNTGDLDVSDDILVAFVIDTDTSFVTITGGIDQYQSILVNTSMTPSSATTADYKVIVDPYNTIGENNESNNHYEDILGYDFSLSKPCANNITMFWERNYLINEQVSMYIQLHNWLMYPASSVEVSFEIISGPSITTPVPLGSAQVGNVRKNCDACAGYYAILPYPTAFPQGGTYEIRMTADPQGQYPEMDAGNNEMIVSVEIINIPDYTTTSSYINPSLLNPDFDENITFDVSYTNIGETNLDSFNIELKVDNIIHETKRVGGLSSGDLATIHFDTPWASNVQGTHAAYVTVDADIEIVEHNENNNEAARTFIVGDAPNIFTDDLTSDNLNPIIGDNINLTATIINEGGLSATFDYTMMYINEVGDTMIINTQSLTLGVDDTTTVIVPWEVDMEQVTIYAIISNSNPLEYNHDDNIAEITLNGFSVLLTAIDVSCNDATDGSISSIVSGGIAPFAYYWSNGATTTDISGLGMGAYTLIVIDSAGTIASASTMLVNGDNIAPEVVCESLTNIELVGNCTSDVDIPIPVAYDYCGNIAGIGNRSDGLALNDPWEIGTTSVTWTFTDIAGNTSTCNQDVVVLDNQGPIVTASGGQYTVAVGTDNCVATWEVVPPMVIFDCTSTSYAVEYAYDDGVYPLVWTSDDVLSNNDGSYSIVNMIIGMTTVRYTVTDEYLNTTFLLANVVVLDNTAPVAQCNEGVNVGLDNQGYASIDATSFDNGSYDNCGDINLQVRRMSPGCGSSASWSDNISFCCSDINNEVMVSLKATDQSGNFSTCLMSITVEDKIDPIITCPDTLFINTDIGTCTATDVELGDAVVIDNCDATTTNNAPESYPLGQTEVMWIVEDMGGNKDTCIQIVVVSDNQVPVISCPSGSPFVNYPAPGQDEYIVQGTEYDATATDNCSFTIINDYNNSSSLENASFEVGDYTIVWTATDIVGNSSTCVIEISISGDDFFINNQALSMGAVSEGDQLLASCRQNYSGASTTNLYPYMAYYLSSDDTWDAMDIWLGHDVSSLKATDLWDTESAMITIPTGTAAGFYHILFKADYHDDYIENDEVNNVSSVSIEVLGSDGQDDFLVVATNLSDHIVTAGDDFIASCMQVYNGGSVQTQISYLGYFLSTDQTWDASDVLLDYDYSTLSTGDPQDGETEALLIPASTAAGDYYILFVADYLEEYDESDELNNVAMESIEILSTTNVNNDFYIGNTILGDSEVNAGDMTIVQCQQMYDGTSTITLKPYIGYFLSEDMNWDASDVLLGDDFSTLSMSDTLDWEIANLLIPNNTLAGDYYILFVTDYKETYVEFNETNNIKSLPIIILGYTASGDDEIYLTNFTSSETVVEENMMVDLVVKQNYTGSSTTMLYPKVGYYISDDQFWDGTDTFLEDDISSINADDTSDWESVTVSIPANTPLGTHYILFVADYTDVVAEEDETNNVAYIEITVVAPAGMIALDPDNTDMESRVVGKTQSIELDEWDDIEVELNSFIGKPSLLLRPNPVSDMVYIDIISKQEGNAHIMIFNLRGQMMYQEQQHIRGIPSELSVMDWSNGIYMVKVIFDNGEVLHKKLLVVK